jgi:hypothetical protein
LLSAGPAAARPRNCVPVVRRWSRGKGAAAGEAADGRWIEGQQSIGAARPGAATRATPPMSVATQARSPRPGCLRVCSPQRAKPCQSSGADVRCRPVPASACSSAPNSCDASSVRCALRVHPHQRQGGVAHRSTRPDNSARPCTCVLVSKCASLFLLPPRRWAGSHSRRPTLTSLRPALNCQLPPASPEAYSSFTTAASLLPRLPTRASPGASATAALSRFQRPAQLGFDPAQRRWRGDAMPGCSAICVPCASGPCSWPPGGRPRAGATVRSSRHRRARPKPRSSRLPSAPAQRIEWRWPRVSPGSGCGPGTSGSTSWPAPCVFRAPDSARGFPSCC